jgi:hypothetical protein
MKPTLFVLAAGMGTRYGGLKQLEGMGPHGETIMDYSIYDAIQAGFGKVVFVIRHDFEDEFQDKIVKKYEKYVDVRTVYQCIDSLPDGYTAPENRVRPWGTNHAVLMGAEVINEPFAVINADDFYGREAFVAIANELARPDRRPHGEYCMVGFNVVNTMTEHGTVSRGVCTVSNGKLLKIVERRQIGYNEKHEIEYLDFDDEKCLLDPSTPVSMNLWGFSAEYFGYSKREFKRFLDKYIDDPKREFYIPSVVDKLIKNGEATVKVLETPSRWFGVTYKEDRQSVIDNLAKLHQDGVYPDCLFA